MPEGFRTLLKRSAYSLCRYTGANWTARNLLHQNGMLILIYHGVVFGEHAGGSYLYRNTVSARDFERHLELLNRLFRPVAAADILAHFEKRRPLPARAVLVSFDDGYRNNLTQAAPLLKKHGVPALFHVTTNYIGNRSVLWPDEVNLRVISWKRPRIPFPASDGHFTEKEVPSGSRMELAQQIRSLCKGLKEEVRTQYLDALRQEPSAALEERDHELYDFLDWEEVRSLSRQAFEIGSHTVSHPILTKISPEQLELELKQSRLRIEKEIGAGCPYIAYPNGQQTDFSTKVIQQASRQYRLGFTGTGDYASLAGDPFTLSRINVPGYQPLAVFEARISGLYRLLSRH